MVLSREPCFSDQMIKRPGLDSQALTAAVSVLMASVPELCS